MAQEETAKRLTSKEHLNLAAAASLKKLNYRELCDLKYAITKFENKVDRQIKMFDERKKKVEDFVKESGMKKEEILQFLV